MYADRISTSNRNERAPVHDASRLSNGKSSSTNFPYYVHPLFNPAAVKKNDKSSDCISLSSGKSYPSTRAKPFALMDMKLANPLSFDPTRPPPSLKTSVSSKSTASTVASPRTSYGSARPQQLQSTSMKSISSTVVSSRASDDSAPCLNASTKSSSSLDTIASLNRHGLICAQAPPPRRANAYVNGPMADRINRLCEDIDDDWRFLENELVLSKVQTNFSSPLAFQKPGIAAIQAGADLLMRVPHGYGKTTTWIIPVMDYVMNLDEAPGVVSAIVVAATELMASQIGAHLKVMMPRDSDGKRLFSPEWFWKEEQLTHHFDKVREHGAHIVVTTSKFLPTLLAASPFDRSSLQFLIIEEVDRILDNEGERWMDSFKANLPENTQLVLTMNRTDSGHQADWLLRERHVEIRVPFVEELNAPQQLFYCTYDEKAAAAELVEIIDCLAEVEYPPVVAVFFDNESSLHTIHNYLKKNKINRVGRLIRRVEKRELWCRELSRFNEGEYDVLLATYQDEKVVDSERLALDIFFQFPDYVEIHKYMKRIKRNGRMRSGHSVTFLRQGDVDRIPGLIKDRSDRGLPSDSLKEIEQNLLRQQARDIERHERTQIRARLEEQLRALDLEDKEDERRDQRAQEGREQNNKNVRRILQDLCSTT